jgi:hypothetical protein
MTPAIETSRAQYLSAVPVKYRGIAERAISGSGSRSNAIKAKCLDCTGYVRAEVEHCRVVTCPLYEFRPRYEGCVAPASCCASQEQQDDSAMPIPERH